MTAPHELFPDEPLEHGIEIVRGADGVDLIDTWTAGRPSVHFTHAEYEAFLDGVLLGGFDFADPPATDGTPPPQTDADESSG